jgi:hypothetical protein
VRNRGPVVDELVTALEAYRQAYVQRNTAPVMGRPR